MKPPSPPSRAWASRFSVTTIWRSEGDWRRFEGSLDASSKRRQPRSALDHLGHCISGKRPVGRLVLDLQVWCLHAAVALRLTDHCRIEDARGEQCALDRVS